MIMEAKSSSPSGDHVFDQLENQLRAATSAWLRLEQEIKRAKEAGEPRPPGELFCAHVALDAAIDFVTSVSGWQDLALPFERLLIALVHLEGGHDVEWLKPHRRRAGAPGITFDKRCLRGRYVAILDYLVARGETKAAANALALKVSPPDFLEHLLDGDGNAEGARTPRVMERWREQLNRSKRGSPERAGYAACEASISKVRGPLDGVAPEIAAKILVSLTANSPM
jgi:hypothetical protein